MDNVLRRYRALACGILCALLAPASGFAADATGKSTASRAIHSSKNDVSPPLREIPPKRGLKPRHLEREPEGMPFDGQAEADPVVQNRLAPTRCRRRS